MSKREFIDKEKWLRNLDLGEIGAIAMEESFLINISENTILLSKKLSKNLGVKDSKENDEFSLEAFKQFLTVEGRKRFHEDILRIKNRKTPKTISAIGSLVEDEIILGVMVMLHIPNTDFIIGFYYYCYELIREYENQLEKVVEQLTEAQEINQLIHEGSSDYIYHLDLRNNICTFSSRAIEVLPLETATFGNAMDQLLSFVIPEDRAIFLNSFTPFLTGESEYHSAEYRVTTRTGEIIWVSCNGKGCHDLEGNPLIIAGSIMDITEAKKSEEKMNQMLYFDSLTGLKNRYSFEKDMEEYLADDEIEGTIVSVDIRNIKKFNETFGYEFGSLVLQEMATLLQTYIAGYVEIYRLEGDKFLIHLLETDVKTITAKLKVFQMQNYKIRNIQGHGIYFDVAIGVAIYPKDGRDVKTLLHNLHELFYKMSKDRTKDLVFYKDDVENENSNRYILENELRYDIENGCEHFRVVYQPIVKVEEGKEYWHSAEALLRYKNPKFPNLTQKELIDTLEMSDLIVPVGRWVIQQAIRECSKWAKLGGELIVHVNLSARQLSDASLFSLVKETCNKYEFDPTQLVCELTETSLINNFETAILVCESLMEFGVGIALDDFGTGYSSFNYLKNLPISQIKIDKEYVDDLTNNEYNQIIIKCLNDLSQSMNMELCVEGVETKEILAILTDMGINMIQGFYFERPLEVDVVRKELLNHICK